MGGSFRGLFAQAATASIVLHWLALLRMAARRAPVTSLQRRNGGLLLTLIGGAVAVAFSFLSASNAMAELVQPKRPLSAYMLWLNENRAKIVKDLGAKDVKAVSKAAGEEWGGLKDKDKQKYQKKADALKAEHEENLKAFKDAGGVVEARRKKSTDTDGKRAKKDPNAPKRLGVNS